MPLTIPSIPSQAAAWADSIVASIDQTGMSVSEKSDLLTSWTNICIAHITFLTSNTLVNTLVTGVTATGPPGGPLPIVAQPGTGTIS
jgi:hypothetical protein